MVFSVSNSSMKCRSRALYQGSGLPFPSASKDENWSKFTGHFVEEKPATVEDITPLSGEGTADFSQIPAGTDMSNAVFGSLYITIDELQGDRFDAEEQALVITTTVSERQMENILNAGRMSDVLQNVFSGIVLQVPAGSGTVTVTAKTSGDRQLAVTIVGTPAEYFTQTVKGEIKVNYNVTEAAYVFIYGVEQKQEVSSAPSKLRKPTAIADEETDNNVSIYSVNINAGTNCVEETTGINRERTIKMLDKDGNIVILKDGKHYNITGCEIGD